MQCIATHAVAHIDIAIASYIVVSGVMVSHNYIGSSDVQFQFEDFSLL